MTSPPFKSGPGMSLEKIETLESGRLPKRSAIMSGNPWAQAAGASTVEPQVGGAPVVRQQLKLLRRPRRRAHLWLKHQRRQLKRQKLRARQGGIRPPLEPFQEPRCKTPLSLASQTSLKQLYIWGHRPFLAFSLFWPSLQQFFAQVPLRFAFHPARPPP